MSGLVEVGLYSLAAYTWIVILGLIVGKAIDKYEQRNSSKKD